MTNNKFKREKIYFIVFIVIGAVFVLNNKILSKGPHTNVNTYPSSIGDACRACHIPHAAKGKRLWPVGISEFTDTTAGVTFIQKLCQYCHYQSKTQAQQSGDFWVGKYGAHILSYAHGQHGPKYSGTALTRYGPGHLYRHSTDDAPLHNSEHGDTVITRDKDKPIQGYGAKYHASLGDSSYGWRGFETMAIEADMSSTNQDYTKVSRLSCSVCHDPHAEYVNIYYDRGGSTQTYNNSNARNYILDSVGSAGSYKPTNYDLVYNSVYIGRTRKICLACHFGGEEPPSSGSYTTSDIDTPTVVDNVVAPMPPSSISDHYDSTVGCVGCHAWDWPPATCNSCHGFPPSANLYIDSHWPSDYNSTFYPAYTHAGVGAHDTHYFGEGYKCNYCHPMGGTTHMNNTVDVNFQFIANLPGGTTMGGTGPGTVNDTCEVTGSGDSKVIRCRVSCHNPRIGGLLNTTWVTWPNPPVGVIAYDTQYFPDKLYTYITCLNCHNYESTYFLPDTASYKNASSHPYLTTNITRTWTSIFGATWVETTNIIPQRNSCSICHTGNDVVIENHQWIYWDNSARALKVKAGRLHTHTSFNVSSDLPPTGGKLDSSCFEWNLRVFDSASTPNFYNPAYAYSSTGNFNSTRALIPFYTRFTGAYDLYNESTHIGFCDPCHDTTEFEVIYGTTNHHGSYQSATFLGTTYLRAPKAATYFYSSTRNIAGGGKATGIGGHGQPVTNVTEHKLGDSRATGDEDRTKCRSCHYYHGSRIDKLLDSMTIRPSDVDFRPSTSSNTTAAGNDNSFCYRCHFFTYDNGFYSKSAYESSIHKTSGWFKIWDDSTNRGPYAPDRGRADSYFWKINRDTTPVRHRTGLCIYCHEPHGGYGWDINVFDTFDTMGFSSMTRGGTRAVYVDNDKYGTTVDLGDEPLCFKCHSYDSTWNVYSDTVWSTTEYQIRAYKADDWDTPGLDISYYFDTTKSNHKAWSHHRIMKKDQIPGALGNPDDFVIIECINCHNPHTVQKNDTLTYSTVENLMDPFEPAKFMIDTTVMNSTDVYKVYNKFCYMCHDSTSQSDTTHRGMIYFEEIDSTHYGKLARRIKFSNKSFWGEGDTTAPGYTGSPESTLTFHSWDKKEYYDTGHGLESTLSIGSDNPSQKQPLAKFGQYGLGCARIEQFACHDPHGSGQISLLKDNVYHPKGNNYNTPHIYDSTSTANDQPLTADRWCGAACHQIGERTGDIDFLHAWTYLRNNPDNLSASGGAYIYGFADTTIPDVDIYNSTGLNEPILDNQADLDRDTFVAFAHSSYSRVPGDGNSWPNNFTRFNTVGYSLYGTTYDSYQVYLPVKKDAGNRFVCFTCHDPHGTKYRGMVRYKYETNGVSDLCLRCHRPPSD